MMNKSKTSIVNDLFLYKMLMAQAPILILSGLVGDKLLMFSIVSSVIFVILTQISYSLLKGTNAFSLVGAFLMMATSAILIQSQMGMIEMHFHIFTTMVVFLVYQRWQPLIVSLVTVAVHHIGFMVLQHMNVTIGNMPIMLLPTADHGIVIMLIHAFFAALETGILIFMAMQMKRNTSSNMKIASAIEEICTNNDLSIRLVEAKEPIEVSFNQFITRLSNLFKDYREIGIKLTDSSNIISKIGEQANTEAQERLVSSQKLAESAKNITSRMQEVTSAINESSNEASDVKQSTMNDSDHALQVMQDMELLENDTTQISVSLSELTKDVESITNLLQSIRSISDQTNLLALNAAIEAARAGETGRGFAVVADEVRTLAQRSSESTDEIEKVLHTLNTSVSKTVESMESGKKRTAINVQKTKEISDGLRERSQQVSSVAQANKNASQETTEQEQALSSIYEQLNGNAEASITLAETMATLSNTSQDILAVTKEYQEKATIYKV